MRASWLKIILLVTLTATPLATYGATMSADVGLSSSAVTTATNEPTAAASVTATATTINLNNNAIIQQQENRLSHESPMVVEKPQTEKKNKNNNNVEKKTTEDKSRDKRQMSYWPVYTGPSGILLDGQQQQPAPWSNIPILGNLPLVGGLTGPLSGLTGPLNGLTGQLGGLTAPLNGLTSGLTGTLGNLGGGLGNLGQLGNIGGLGNLGLLGGGAKPPGIDQGVGQCPLSQTMRCRCESLVPIKTRYTQVVADGGLEILTQNSKHHEDGSVETLAHLSNGLIIYQKTKRDFAEGNTIEGFYSMKITEDQHLIITYKVDGIDYTVKADVNTEAPRVDLSGDLI